MPVPGFEEFTPSHDYKIMSDEAAFEMGALFADVKRRKDANKFNPDDVNINSIIKGSTQSTGNEGTVLAKKGSPINFGGLAGVASGVGGLFGGATGAAAGGGIASVLQSLLGGSVNPATENNRPGNAQTDAQHTSQHKQIETLLGEGSEENQIESVVNQDQVAPTGVQVEKTPTALDTAKALNTSESTLNRTNSLYGTADERGLPAMSSPDEYANVLKPQVV